MPRCLPYRTSNINFSKLWQLLIFVTLAWSVQCCTSCNPNGDCLPRQKIGSKVTKFRHPMPLKKNLQTKFDTKNSPQPVITNVLYFLKVPNRWQNLIPTTSTCWAKIYLVNIIPTPSRDSSKSCFWCSVRLPASSAQLLSQVSPPASQAQDHPQPPARPSLHVICVEKKLKTRKVLKDTKVIVIERRNYRGWPWA